MNNGMDILQVMNNTIMSRMTETEMDSLQSYSTRIENIPAEDAVRKEKLSGEISRIMLSKQFYSPSLVSVIVRHDPVNMDVNHLMMKNLFETGWNIEDKLKTLEIPTVIINGTYDPIGDQPVKALQQSIAGSKLHMIENCGHFVWIEKPNELQNIIENFLKEIEE